MHAHPRKSTGPTMRIGFQTPLEREYSCVRMHVKPCWQFVALLVVVLALLCHWSLDVSADMPCVSLTSFLKQRCQGRPAARCSC
eukprot:642654-Pelagomonas_calceolata.AAC.1